MIDVDLQMRFWRNMTDAMTHGTEAAFAAAAVWQKDMLSTATAPSKPPQSSAAAFGSLMWPFQPQRSNVRTQTLTAWPMWWMPAPAPSTYAVNPFAVMTPSSYAAMMPWAEFYRNAFAQMAPNGPYAQWAKTFAPFFPWPVMTWAMTQMPLTAMLLSTGMPYSVASPSAKAGTCAMDAAEAARQQMQNVYAAYRSDGGHAAAQLVTLPWTLAASFMTAAAATAPTSTRLH